MRRCFSGLILAIAALSIAATPATPAAGNELEDLAAQYKKAGEPIEPVDFEVKDVADADNAALELRAAAKAFRDDSETWKALEELPAVEPPLNQEQELLLQRVALENLKVIEHIDAAMQRKSVDWKIKMTSPTYEILLPHLGKARGLARMVAADALLMHHQGSHGEALRDIRRTLFIGRAVDQEGFLIGHLVWIAITTHGVSVLEMITPDLKIDGEGSPASQQQVKELIGELLDDAPSQAALIMALQSERMSQLDITRCIAEGRITPQTPRGARGRAVDQEGGGTGGWRNPAAALDQSHRRGRIDDGLADVQVAQSGAS